MRWDEKCKMFRICLLWLISYTEGIWQGNWNSLDMVSLASGGGNVTVTYVAILDPLHKSSSSTRLNIQSFHSNLFMSTGEKCSIFDVQCLKFLLWWIKNSSNDTIVLIEVKYHVDRLLVHSYHLYSGSLWYSSGFLVASQIFHLSFSSHCPQHSIHWRRWLLFTAASSCRSSRTTHVCYLY